MGPRRKGALALAYLLSLAACAGKHHPFRPAPPQPAWRQIATPADRQRLRNWRLSFSAALASITRAGEAEKLASQAALMAPDAALPDPAPPPGDYRCRTIKLGTDRPGAPEYIAYPAFTCRIALGKDGLSFAKLGGPQRPVGRLFPDDGWRMIFLGTLMLADETRAYDYGRDPERDMAGALERVGPREWRLVLPYPRWESTLDVIELTLLR